MTQLLITNLKVIQRSFLTPAAREAAAQWGAMQAGDENDNALGLGATHAHNSDQALFRLGFNDLMTYVSVLEIASQARFVPDPLPENVRGQLQPSLEHPTARQYYEEQYTLVLPQLLRQRLKGADSPHIALDAASRSARLFMSFLDISQNIIADSNAAMFLELAVENGAMGISRDDLFEVASQPDRLGECLSRDAKVRSPLDAALCGFRSFGIFCQQLHQLLERAHDIPLIQSSFWHFYAYWFGCIADQIDFTMREMLGRMQLWSAGDGETQMSLDSFRVTISALTSGRYGKQLRRNTVATELARGAPQRDPVRALTALEFGRTQRSSMTMTQVESGALGHRVRSGVSAAGGNRSSTKGPNEHIRPIAELNMLAPIKASFIETPGGMTYATRLQVILKTLFELTQRALERDQLKNVEVYEWLRLLRSWTLVDGKLLWAVTFERSLESSLSDIGDFAGPLLDLVFSHCQGYEGHRRQDGSAAFMSWVRGHQLEHDFFYASLPELSGDDLRSLQSQLARQGADLHDAAIANSGGNSIGQVPEESGYSALEALHDLKKWFPGEASNPKSDLFLWNAVARVAIPRLEHLTPALVRDSETQRWLIELQLPQPGRSRPAEQIHNLAEIVQANILEPCEGLTHGLVTLLRCRDAAAVHALLRRVAGRVTAHAQRAQRPVINLGFSYAGLKHVQREASLLELPKEFREGMEARAGLLGDVAMSNGPESWRLPQRNWPGDPRAGEAVALSAVDIVVIVQDGPEVVEGDHRFSIRHPLYETLLSLVAEPGVEVLHVQALRRYPEPDKRELFEFDGPSDIVPQDDASRATQRHPVELGEILLGHANTREHIETWPSSDQKEANLLRNGSFLVLRKLEQSVEAYQRFASENAVGDSRTHQMMKRREFGGRAFVMPDGDSNHFDDDRDPAEGCAPLRAHVRRANPRGMQRVLRRGMPYSAPLSEPSMAGERGMLFMAYNSDIKAQFEEVQRRWNSISSAADAVRGVMGPPAVVRLRWGMYLFVPSMSVLRAWASANLDEHNASQSDD